MHEGAANIQNQYLDLLKWLIVQLLTMRKGNQINKKY